MIQSLTVAGVAVDTVVMPSLPAFKSVEWTYSDTVGEVVSPFSKQTQVQEWLGADEWAGTLTWPTLTQLQAKHVQAFLLQCRGIRNPFLFGDPMQVKPEGNLQHSIPLVDNSVTGSNAFGTQTLYLKSLTPSTFRLLLPGDHLQVGFRLYKVLDPVNSDVNGKAVVAIWPSLREVPTDGSAVIFSSPKGLFRRANNDQTASGKIGNFYGLVSISVQIKEFR